MPAAIVLVAMFLESVVVESEQVARVVASECKPMLLSPSIVDVPAVTG